MKCPKCDYLGFETGDRCKNCGYDFSLLTADVPAREPDLPLRESPAPTPPMPWLDHFDREPETMEAATAPEPGPPGRPEIEETPAPEPAAVVAPRPRLVDPALPLFNPEAIDDDTPLIKLPATPRAPLSVRRTPETPRLRAVPKPHRRTAAEAAAIEPVLAFAEEPAEAVEDARPVRVRQTPTGETSAPGRRVAAAALDHAILFGIDAVVIYFTLRLAEVTIADWRQLPVVPMVVFLGLVKAAYFCVFTLVGGQTIGKMAAHIRVIVDDEAPMDAARAVRRTLGGGLSMVTFGLAFLPALLASDRRAIHDRLARTRVVALS